MGYAFLETLSTPSVKAAQDANGSEKFWTNFAGHRDFAGLTDAEAEFIALRDSFYMATISENGWPYIQHRGGPPGFLRVLDSRTLAFADFRGNRQYISVGNLGANDQAALILMDYPGRRRLKLLGHMEVKKLEDDIQLAQRIAVTGCKAKVERALVIHLKAFDWNCPQHLTRRFTEAELTSVLTPVRARLAALENENRALRAQLADLRLGA
jgi:predicted pyridoxine 5'-phosphate oxidase superfamily flavin-nucleotide-binding protein